MSKADPLSGGFGPGPMPTGSSSSYESDTVILNTDSIHAEIMELLIATELIHPKSISFSISYQGKHFYVHDKYELLPGEKPKQSSPITTSMNPSTEPSSDQTNPTAPVNQNQGPLGPRPTGTAPKLTRQQEQRRYGLS